MPIYEYRCKSCGHTLEVIQKVSDKALKKCTECSGPLEKLISRSAFQLKGGGWYSEGYKGQSGSSSPAPTADSKSDSKTSSKTDSKSDKTDSKPEKKAAAGGCASGGCGCH